MQRSSSEHRDGGVREGNLREELIGHATLAILGVLGLALYATTYSIVYAGSSSTTPVVAVFEMWMVTVHMASPIICGTVQALTATDLKVPLKYVAVAQTSLFLGVACIVTIKGIDCVQENLGVCSAYYGAAAIPRFAAAGSVAWVWVMYVSSLGCQSGGGLSMGLTGKSSLTAASIILLVPYFIASKLGSTCGGSKWTYPLCNNACNVEGPLLVVIMSLTLSHGGWLLIGLKQHTIGATVSIIGPLIMIIGCFSLWAEQPLISNARHIITCAIFSGITLLSGIYEAYKSKARGGKSRKKPKLSFFSIFSGKPRKASSSRLSNTTATARSMFSSSTPPMPYQRIV